MKTVGVLLTYNCSKLVEKAYQSIPRQYFDEIVCADDGSSDGTVEVVRTLGVSVTSHEHLGYGGNLFSGFQEALKRGATHIFELHGDGQYDFSSVPVALDLLREECDLVLGDRFHDLRQPLRDGMDPIRYFGNLFLTSIGRMGLGIPTRDLFPGFRAYSRRLVERVDLAEMSKSYFFSFEIIAQAKYLGLKIGRVPVRCDYKGAHTSMGFAKGIPAILHTTYTVCLYRLAKLGIRRGPFASLPEDRRPA